MSVCGNSACNQRYQDNLDKCPKCKGSCLDLPYSLLDFAPLEKIRQALQDNKDILKDKEKVMGLLDDSFTSHQLLKNLMLSCFSEHIPQEMASSTSVSSKGFAIFFNRLTANWGTSEISARYAIVSWAFVLGCMTPKECKSKLKTYKENKRAFIRNSIYVTVALTAVCSICFFANKFLNTSEPYSILSSPSRVKVGDTVLLGSYPLSKEGKVKPIKWRVLANENTKALLISKLCLDSQPYNNINKPVTWAESQVRKWLNDSFYNSAFNNDEKERIILSHLTNPDQPIFDTPGGYDTDDRVFLLSIGEALHYFKDGQDRMAEATDYAQSKGGYSFNVTEYTWWWLRSPGAHPDNAAYVNYCVGRYKGFNVYYFGTSVASPRGSVRPCVWISLK